MFCSASLPVNILSTAKVEPFLERARGSNLLGVEGSQMPDLLGRRIEVQGVVRQGADWWNGSKDIVLSSCGWVMVSSTSQEEVKNVDTLIDW